MTNDVREARQLSHGRYEILDACRGIAAVLVVCYHFGTLERHGTHQYVPYGYLAVDFFFVLSGFVIDRSYSAKLKAGLSLRSFLSRRLLRLYPLYALGQTLGVFRQIAGAMLHEPRALSAAKIGVAYACGLLLLPSPFAGRHLYALNSPSWSIFYELIANAVFAACVYSLHRKFIAIIAAFMFAYLAVLACASGQIYDFGQSWTNAYGGLFRVTYGFLVGVAISRYATRPPALSNISYLLLAMIVVFIGLPQMQTTAGIGSLYSLLFIGIVAPFIVLMGALCDARSGIKLCAFLGGVSYPLYIVHPFLTDPTIAVMRLLHLSPPVGTVVYLLISLAAATGLYVAYDLQVARFVKQWGRQSEKPPQATIAKAGYG